METAFFSASLFAASFIDWNFWLIVLEVAVALGLIIFVHELGHFLVAKACGVRCDKFYIGFDFFGWKLCKFKWGETEYGIGVFPLGGYVKMLGQEDNPGELQDRLEKAKAAREALAKNAETNIAPENILSDEQIAEMENMMNDPRSYQSKSVPQRLAIITAGVIMNVIFAFIAAVLAFTIGTYKGEPRIQDVFTSQAAWEAGLQPEDTVKTIAGQNVQYFDQFAKYIMLGDDLEQGVPLTYHRPGYDADIMALVYPRKYFLAPMLGAAGSGVEMQVRKGHPYLMETPAEEACQKAGKPMKLVGGEQVLRINGEKVENYLDYRKACYRGLGLPMTVNFSRNLAKNVPKKSGKESLDTSSLAAYPDPNSEKDEKAYYFDMVFHPKKLRHFGVVFDMGPVQMTQVTTSGLGPARRAGILPGDTLLEIEVDGKMQPIGDPMTLPYRIHCMAKTQDTVRFKVRRGEKKDVLNIPADMPGALEMLEGAKEDVVLVQLDKDPVPADLSIPGSGLAIPEIGLCYIPSTRIARVLPGSKAEKDGLKPGDILTQITLKYYRGDIHSMGEEQARRLEKLKKEFPKTTKNYFRKEICSLPFFWNAVQSYPIRGTSLEVIVARKDAEGNSLTCQAVVDISEYDDIYTMDPGLLLEPRQRILVEAGLSQALALGAEETWNSLTLVFRTLEKLFSGQVSVRGLGGPVLIAQAAYQQAKDGWSTLLMFVCLVSANLAVMNLLPIPVLDGGHVVFLLYEGITGKAPNENLVIMLTYAGLLLFLGLTVFVFALDLGFISRF